MWWWLPLNYLDCKIWSTHDGRQVLWSLVGVDAVFYKGGLRPQGLQHQKLLINLRIMQQLLHESANAWKGNKWNSHHSLIHRQTIVAFFKRTRLVVEFDSHSAKAIMRGKKNNPFWLFIFLSLSEYVIPDTFPFPNPFYSFGIYTYIYIYI